MKRVISIFLIMVSLLSLAGCKQNKDGQSNAEKERVITINYAQSFPSGTMLVMREEGFLDKYLPENVKIEWTGLTAAAEIRDALVANSVDIADMSLGAFIAGIQNNLPLRLISYASTAPINLYTNIPEAETMNDLPNDCQITVNSFTSALHIAFLAQSLHETGALDTFATNLVPTPNLEAAALLAEGTVDAAILSFPTMLKTEEMDRVHMLSDFHDVILEYSIGSAFITSETFYSENSDIIEAFRQAQQDALALYDNNRERFAEIMAKEYGIDTEIVLEKLAQYPPTNALTGYDKQAELLYSAGILNSEAAKFQDLPNRDDLVG